MLDKSTKIELETMNEENFHMQINNTLSESKKQQQKLRTPVTTKQTINKFNIEINPAKLDTLANQSSSNTPHTTNNAKDQCDSVNLASSNKQQTSTEILSQTGVMPVEEGYATRQMDEYFRQTIAAIKEELHKKLESTQQPNDPLNTQDTKTASQANEADRSADINCIDCYLNSHCIIHALHTNQRRHSNIFIRNSNLNWILLLFVFVNHMLIDGFHFNIICLLDIVNENFFPKADDNRIHHLLPFILFTFVYLSMCPFSIYFCKAYGLRRTAICGSLLSFASVFVSSFVNFSFGLFVLFFSILTGKFHELHNFLLVFELGFDLGQYSRFETRFNFLNCQTTSNQNVEIF
jgi:hypothetical protein